MQWSRLPANAVGRAPLFLPLYHTLRQEKAKFFASGPLEWSSDCKKPGGPFGTSLTHCAETDFLHRLGG